MVLFKGNENQFPVDPKQALATMEKVFAGGEMILTQGVTEIGYFTSANGYAIVEADSKEKVLSIIAPFFPLFTMEVQEIVPFEKAKEAVLSSLRAVAGSS